MKRGLTEFIGQRAKWEKTFFGAALTYFTFLSLFLLMAQPVASWGHFYEKFLNERYTETIALLKSHGEVINEFEIMGQAYSAENEDTKNNSAAPGSAKSDLAKRDVGAVCQFNKKVIISYIHREYPHHSWDHIERNYERKREYVGFYRMADWLGRYAVTMLLFWLAPATIGYFLLKHHIQGK
jgi:hypothetical protein